MSVKKTVRVAGYCRVATRKQRFDAQQLGLENFCRDNGFELTRVFEDRGPASLTHQPGWQELKRTVVEGGIDLVVTINIGRISPPTSCAAMTTPTSCCRCRSSSSTTGSARTLGSDAVCANRTPSSARPLNEIAS